MKLTEFQKNILTFAGLGALGVGVYFLVRRKKEPPLITTDPRGEGEKLIAFLYNYFSDFFQWGIALDQGAYIKPYVDQLMVLNSNQLQKANDYYIKYYSNVTGEPLLSSWLDNQYYTLGITDDPFDSAIIYLQNLGY